LFTANLEKVVEAGPNKFYLLRRINLDIQPSEFVTIMARLARENPRCWSLECWMALLTVEFVHGFAGEK